MKRPAVVSAAAQSAAATEVVVFDSALFVYGYQVNDVGDSASVGRRSDDGRSFVSMP